MINFLSGKARLGDALLVIIIVFIWGESVEHNYKGSLLL